MGLHNPSVFAIRVCVCVSVCAAPFFRYGFANKIFFDCGAFGFCAFRADRNQMSILTFIPMIYWCWNIQMHKLRFAVCRRFLAVVLFFLLSHWNWHCHLNEFIVLDCECLLNAKRWTIDVHIYMKWSITFCNFCFRFDRHALNHLRSYQELTRKILVPQHSTSYRQYPMSINWERTNLSSCTHCSLWRLIFKKLLLQLHLSKEKRNGK